MDQQRFGEWRRCSLFSMSVRREPWGTGTIFACSRTRSAGPGRNSKPRKDRGPRESSWTELRSPSRSRARHMRVADGLAPEPLELWARIYRERATGRCDAEVWIGPFPEFI